MRLLFTAFLSVISLSAGTVSAQVVPGTIPSPGERDLIRDRQERVLEEQRRRLEELQQLPGRDAQLQAAPAADDERCFEIRTIRLQGATHISDEQQASLLAPSVVSAWAPTSSTPY